MRSLFTTLWNRIADRLWRRKLLLQTTWVEDLPDNLAINTIYITGENEHWWFAAMLCPCRCGETLYMNLQPATRPVWQLFRHKEGTITLHPSIWRTVGCRSHFFIRRGRVYWCGNQ